MMAANMTKPEFTKRISEVTPLAPLVDSTDLLQWLAGEENGAGRDAGLTWLLATTFSEVVWGKRDADAWQLSNKAASLPASRLLELRAFGPDAEIFVWRDATGLRARLRRDVADGKGADTYDEEQLLWGTVRPDVAPGEVPPGFTRLAEGDQGLEHEPPLDLDASYFVKERDDKGNPNKHYGHRPARLVLRHYVGREDATGLARVVDSRLVEVRKALPGE